MKKRPITQVGIVLDRSTSMDSIRAEMIAGFNDQLGVLKKSVEQGNEVYITLVPFATFVDRPVFLNAPIESVPDLTPERYVPNGSTAMLDAVADTIDLLIASPNAKDEDVSFLLLVISDGAENASARFGGPEGYTRIAEKVKALQETKRWTIVYLGANQKLDVVQDRLNLVAGNTSSFDSTSSGTAHANRATAQGLQNYMTGRSTGQTHSNNFYSGQ